MWTRLGQSFGQKDIKIILVRKYQKHPSITPRANNHNLIQKELQAPLLILSMDNRKLSHLQPDAICCLPLLAILRALAEGHAVMAHNHPES